MKTFRQIYKITFFLVTAAIYFPLAFLIKVSVSDVFKRRKILTWYCSQYSKAICWALGVKIKTKGLKKNLEKGQLLVSNHMSYMDIFVISANFPGCFVTSIELRNTFFLGLIAEMAACVFVERRSRENLSNEIIDITNTLKKNVRVLLYPESIATNGDAVLRFKRPLFQSAIDSGAAVQPVTINYDISLSDRDDVCWYDDRPFINHFLIFISRPVTNVELTIHPLITSSGQTAELLAETSHASVSAAYKGLKK